MPFLTAKAPVRRGNVYSFRVSAAAGECPRVGKPAVCWLNRAGLPRGAVVQPYLTPRFTTNGRDAPGRRKAGGNCAQLVGSFGAIVHGRCRLRVKACPACRGDYSSFATVAAASQQGCQYTRCQRTKSCATNYGNQVRHPQWFITLLPPRFHRLLAFIWAKIKLKVRSA
jgi:hypothetical protein